MLTILGLQPITLASLFTALAIAYYPGILNETRQGQKTGTESTWRNEQGVSGMVLENVTTVTENVTTIVVENADEGGASTHTVTETITTTTTTTASPSVHTTSTTTKTTRPSVGSSHGIGGFREVMRMVRYVNSLVYIANHEQRDHHGIVLVKIGGMIPCETVPTGFYPSPDDCSKFSRCVDSVVYNLFCPHGLHFDPKRITCVESKDSECRSNNT